MNHKLAIGLCTYKRCEMLNQCLNSLNKMDRPKDIDLLIIIADNDEASTAKLTVEKFRMQTDIPVYYEVEQGRGIPYARNSVLKQAKEHGVTELAFIDDDEYVEKSWLVNLWDYYILSSANVVRGLVKTIYPSNTPKWIVKGQFYQRHNYETGKVFTSSNTGNVLINYSKLVKDWNLTFDESYGMTGGSDKDFFRKANSKGALIMWVDNAVVNETLSEDRFSLLYLLKRKFRTRNSELNFKNLSVIKWIKLFIKSTLKILKGVFLLPVNCLFGKHEIVASLVSIVIGVAKLLGLLKIHIKWEEYKD